jgi:hypothetical protein
MCQWQKPHTHLSIYPSGWQAPGAQPMASQSRQYWRASPHPSSHEPNTSPSFQLMADTAIVGRREILPQMNYRMPWDRVRHISSTRPIREYSREPLSHHTQKGSRLAPALAHERVRCLDVRAAGVQTPTGALDAFARQQPMPLVAREIGLAHLLETTTTWLRTTKTMLLVNCGTTLSWGQGRIPACI